MPLKNLKAGSYIVTFSNPGYETLRAEINVSKDGLVGCVKVEGGSCGSTTPPGINMIGKLSVFGTLKPIAAPPPPPPTPKGYISVTSSPANASVDVNGTDIGKTPVTGYELTTGSKLVTLRLSGYKPEERSVKITEGETATVDATLVESAEPTVICGWIDEVGVGSLTADHARYVYLLSTGSTDLAELKYQGLTPKPSPIAQSLATLDNARGIYVYSTGGFVLGNLKTGCNY